MEKMKSKGKVLKILFIFVSAFFVSCSSAPKRPMLVTDTYNAAYTQLESANQNLLAGRLSSAHSCLTESYNLALSVDNPSLLCKICLSGVTYKILESRLNQTEAESKNQKSFLDADAASVLLEAKSFAARSSEKLMLLDLCDVYEVKSKISDSKSSETLSAQDKKNFISILDKSEKSVSKEPYYHGFLERTRGDVFMELNDYKNALSSYVSAASIHTKSRYVYEIGLDWYGAARASSLGGDKNEAVSSIEKALKYDRDAENTGAISLDYLAYSKILLKGNPTEEDVKKAEMLKNLSEKIYAAGKDSSAF